jgi:hypothetical protein
MRSDALESRADRGMHAYVTGGRPVTTRAKRQACALRPHATSRGELDGSQHTNGAKAIAHAPPGMRRSRGRARMKAGDACAVLQGRLLRWQCSRQRVALVPVVSTGARETARARTIAPLPLP